MVGFPAGCMVAVVLSLLSRVSGKGVRAEGSGLLCWVQIWWGVLTLALVVTEAPPGGTGELRAKASRFGAGDDGACGCRSLLEDAVMGLVHGEGSG